MTILALVALLAGSNVWSRAETRRRARFLREFAALHAWSEIPTGALVPGFPGELRREGTMPAFRGTAGARTFSFVPVTTRIRYGYAWALCVEHPDTPPVFVLSSMSSTLWRAFGRLPRGFVRITAGVQAEFAARFTAYMPATGDAGEALPAAAQQTLAPLNHRVVAWIVRADLAVLMIREPYIKSGRDVWIPQSVAALTTLLPPPA